MPISENDILQIKDFQTCLGKNMLNVYYYQATQVNSEFLTYDRVLLSFNTTVVNEVIRLQSQDLTHNLLTVDNVSNQLDFDALAPLSIGLNATPINDFSTAISFRFERSNKITRSGGKRIGGLADDAFDQNELVLAYQTIAIDVASGMETAQTISVVGEGQVGILTPVLVGRFANGQLDLSRVQPLSQVSFKDGASTQVSRKRL